jgi:hypothetical protein
MRVRLLRDWSYHKQGEVAEVFEPTARNWLINGIAEAFAESRSIDIEQAVEQPVEAVERAVVGRKPRKQP